MKNSKLLLILCWAIFSCKGKIRNYDNNDSLLPVQKAVISIECGDKCTSCHNCLVVDRSLEADSFYNAVLGQFLYKSLLDGYECPSIDDSLVNILVQRQSFLNTLTLFFPAIDSSRVSNCNKDLDLNEVKMELLYNINDSLISHRVADFLLKKGSFDGVLSLWGKTNFSLLPELKGYLQKYDTGNFYSYAEIAAIAHLKGDSVLKQIYLKKAVKIRGFEDENGRLLDLLRSGHKFDIVEFKEEIYGGM